MSRDGEAKPPRPLILRYSTHAEAMMVERSIERIWVERTLSAPDTVEPDPTHADRQRAFRSVPERDGRVLRVVHVKEDDAIRSVSRSGAEAQPMKASYDPEADALYLRLADVAVVDSEEVRPGIVLDFDADGRLAAIEVLDAREHLARGSDLSKLIAA